MVLINYDNEYSKIKEVVLYRPNIKEIATNNANEVMYVDIPDPNKVLEEFDCIVSKLQSLNIKVTILKNSEGMPITPNMIFLRDVALPFRNDLLLANMKHSIRKDEPSKFKELLFKQEGFNKCISLEKEISIEGADLFVMSKNLVYLYTGNRTNPLIADTLKRQYNELEIKTIRANIKGVPQHILGGVHILDDKIATRRIKYCQDNLKNYNFIDFDENPEIAEGFSLNIFTLSPREILMPMHRPKTKKQLELKGIICHEVNINEIHKMGGGLACMILPLSRE